MAISQNDFRFVQALARKEAGLVLEAGKEYLVESRLEPVARHAGLASLADLVATLRACQATALRDQAIDALTTNETTFFRDIEPFERLRKDVLPQLMELRKRERTLSIWYAASSTGQEPYSVSMMIREHLPELLTWDLQQLATDISPTVLARAREGRYGQSEINRGLPAAYLVKYFDRHGTEWRVKECVRSMVRFEERNLIKPWSTMAPVDIVMIRNVLIYFDVEMKKQVLAQVRRILRPDGYLFLGGAETTMNLDDSFIRQPFPRAGCYRLKDHQGAALAAGTP
jgi:chemotaxis protein methyltransferase CheR